MEIVLATNNAHKLEELRRMLENAGHTLHSLEEVGVGLTQPENGATFAENALIKAAETCQRSGIAALGDDSGLCVDALAGEPGVRSARFAGNHGDDAANNKKLLSLLERVPYAKRTAAFVCAVALVLPSGQRLEAQGRCAGLIGFAGSGGEGFGYDPLFYVNGRSFSEMSAGDKDAISHRGAALKQLVGKLPAFLAERGGANG